MTVPYDYFLPDVMPHVPDCPEPMIIRAIQASARDFLETSLMWQDDLGPISIRAWQNTYTPVPPFGSDIAMVLRVLLENNPLRATTLEMLDDTEPGWRKIRTLRPTRFVLTRSGAVRLIPQPVQNIPDALRVQVALKPNRLSPGLPDSVYLDWSESITRGALARLFEIPGTTWFNPDLSTYHSRQYRAGVMRAKGKHLKDYSRVSLRAKPCAFV
ncbi:hypothetical protein [Desulfovibrio inopinatus]|uniref:hypothetical protein n=1 Tax=Desulfovibrio inopinatus TaxID=102109 RepID=UPI0004878F76|nr:hypothetical protein [Desulfovibrio inopinatus]